MAMDKDDFKKGLSDLLFLATKSEELTVERVLDVVDKIAEDVLDLANRYLKIRQIMNHATIELSVKMKKELVT